MECQGNKNNQRNLHPRLSNIPQNEKHTSVAKVDKKLNRIAGTERPNTEPCIYGTLVEQVYKSVGKER